jgi:hypothetical protein
LGGGAGRGLCGEGGGFDSFATSVILGMDPAPRMSVANVERLFEDLANATVCRKEGRKV